MELLLWMHFFFCTHAEVPRLLGLRPLISTLCLANFSNFIKLHLWCDGRTICYLISNSKATAWGPLLAHWGQQVHPQKSAFFVTNEFFVMFHLGREINYLLISKAIFLRTTVQASSQLLHKKTLFRVLCGRNWIDFIAQLWWWKFPMGPLDERFKSL